MFESLENRRLMTSAVDVRSSAGENAINYSYADGSSYQVDLDDEAGLVSRGITVIRYGDEMTLGTASTGGAGGVFDLPTVKADGSVRIDGSVGDDAITAEASIGVHESYEEDTKRPVDGEMDFVIAIDPQTGERYVTTLRGGLSIERQLGGLNGPYGSLAGARRELADVLADPTQPAETADEVRATIASYQAQISRLTDLAGRIESGAFVRYTLAGVYDCYVQVADGQSSGAKLTIDGGAGNDAITVSTNVPMKTSIFGGSGADVLTSGKRTASLFGGGGNDRLISRSTKGGTLDGGKGADRYWNRAAIGEINIAGRDDGDRIVAGTRTVRITTIGTLGVDAATGSRPKRMYFLVADDGGQVDLLA